MSGGCEGQAISVSLTALAGEMAMETERFAVCQRCGLLQPGGWDVGIAEHGVGRPISCRLAPPELLGNAIS